MNSKKIFIIIIIFMTIIILMAFFSGRNSSQQITQIQQETISAPSPTPSIKSFQFEESTDLEAELEKVNPQVFDSDFE